MNDNIIYLRRGLDQFVEIALTLELDISIQILRQRRTGIGA